MLPAPVRTPPGRPASGSSGTARAPATSAREAAEAGGHERLDLEHRDVDVPLSELGERQARPLGRWIADQPADQRPTVLWSSPYVGPADGRAGPRAGRPRPASGWSTSGCASGSSASWTGLTRRGITAQFPEESERRRAIGKFYHRPPAASPGPTSCSGCARCSTTSAPTPRASGSCSVVHQVVVLLTRYVLEGMDEQQVLALDAEAEVLNCAVTSYSLRPDGRADGPRALQRGRLRSRSRTPRDGRAGRAACRPLSRSSRRRCSRTGRCRRSRTGRTRTPAAWRWWSAARSALPAPCCWPGWRRCGWGPASCRSSPSRRPPWPWPWRSLRRASSGCPPSRADRCPPTRPTPSSRTPSGPARWSSGPG
jgi:broad specificity phosphatase PhoE